MAEAKKLDIELKGYDDDFHKKFRHNFRGGFRHGGHGNPMVSPDLLGVSAGAGFGAALAMLNNLAWWQVQVSAFAFGSLAVLMASTIGYAFARQEITVMVLGGIVVSSLFQALLSILKTMADTDNVLPSITFWLMGSLGRGSNHDVLVLLPFLAVSLLLLFLFRYSINALSTSNEEAAALRINVGLVKAVVIAFFNIKFLINSLTTKGI